MPKNIIITSGEGQTGHLIAELILTDQNFSNKVDKLTVTTLEGSSHPQCKDLAEHGASVVTIPASDVSAIAETLQTAGADTIMVIPPATGEKFNMTQAIIKAAKKVGIANLVLLSSAGADMADPVEQPRLREFISLETLAMSAKGDDSTSTGTSPCIIRAGFYAENLLLYNKMAQRKGKLPLPMGGQHKFAPVALGDVARIAAHVLTGEGPHGLDDKHRGQLITLTGPMLAAGEELATAASKALGTSIEYEDISEDEARKILESESGIDEAEKEYLLQYYQLVREGKTNYISTHAFHDITGAHPTELVDFFKAYSADFTPKLPPQKKRKTNKQ